MTALWQRTIEAAPPLQRWLTASPAELRVGRLPRSAWAIVAGSIARVCHARGRPLLILVQAPDRFAEELRPWLAGRPATHVFAEVAVSFLDRPPATDDAVNKRLEALAALADAGRAPVIVVSSRRAAGRMTISPAELAEGTLGLAPGQGPDPIAVATRLVELVMFAASIVRMRWRGRASLAAPGRSPFSPCGAPCAGRRLVVPDGEALSFWAASTTGCVSA